MLQLGTVTSADGPFRKSCALSQEKKLEYIIHIVHKQWQYWCIPQLPNFYILGFVLMKILLAHILLDVQDGWVKKTTTDVPLKACTCLVPKWDHLYVTTLDLYSSSIANNSPTKKLVLLAHKQEYGAQPTVLDKFWHSTLPMELEQ